MRSPRPPSAYLVRRAQREFDESKVPLLGVMGAFVFRRPDDQFSGGDRHQRPPGGRRVARLHAGTRRGHVVMTAILAIQALVFQDGGILALGANVLNMAVLGVLAGYLPLPILERHRLAQGRDLRGRRALGPGQRRGCAGGTAGLEGPDERTSQSWCRWDSLC